MSGQIAYPSREIECDEREAAEGGADGLLPIMRALQDVNGVEERRKLTVKLVVRALRTDSRYAEECVKKGLNWLEDAGWYVAPWSTEREYEILRVYAAFRVARRRDRRRFRALDQMHENKVTAAHERWRQKGRPGPRRTV